jgi:hypothetical protein
MIELTLSTTSVVVGLSHGRGLSACLRDFGSRQWLRQLRNHQPGPPHISRRETESRRATDSERLQRSIELSREVVADRDEGLNPRYHLAVIDRKV